MNDRNLEGRGLVNLSSHVFSSEANDSDCRNDDLPLDKKDECTWLAVPFALPKLVPLKNPFVITIIDPLEDQAYILAELSQKGS